MCSIRGQVNTPPFLTHRTGHQRRKLCVGLGLAEARDAVAGFPLAAFLENFDALKALHDVAFAALGGRRAQAAML